MATAKSEDTKDTAKNTTKDDRGTYDPVKNPSGASEEQIRKGERVGKPLNPKDDPTMNVFTFTDAYTGEPVETHQVVHDVATGVNEDGSLVTEKADKVFFTPSAEGEGKGGASGGEAGEKATGGTTK